MRAGVAESCPVIIAYHMRSHPEAVSYCSRPLSTHPPPVRTACPAQDFCVPALFGDEDGGCAHRSGTLAHIQGVCPSSVAASRVRRDTAQVRKSSDT